MPRLPVCLLVLVSAGGTAAAQYARYPRQQPAAAPSVLSDRVKPATPVAAPSARAKPELDADVVLSIESLRTPIRGEQEQILASLIANTPDSEAEEKADYYFRLGELYAKQHRMWRDKHLERASNDAANRAKLYLLKAVKTYKGLTDNPAFREYPKLDMALFYYGYTLQSGKYMKEARAVFDKLLKTFPNSRYVPEAHLAFADYYFDAGQLADAEARYKQVLKFPKSAAYWYATYRLGWIHVQLSRTQAALETFYRVTVATRNDPKQAALFRAARADFVRAYAQIGKPERAHDAFTRVDKTAALELVELLADIAHDSGAMDRAVPAYRDLVVRVPADLRVCDWQYRIARATLSLPNATHADKVKEIDALVKIYARQKPASAECGANAAAMSGEVAAAYHAEWSKTRSLETLGYAEQLYGIHIAAFPDAAAQRAAYAEVLWTRADHEKHPKLRAARWQRAAEAFASTPTAEAARATALAWMNALDIATPTATRFVLSKVPRSRPRARPLEAREAKLVAAVTAYLAHAPAADAELAQMRFAVAMTFRRHRQFDDAVTALDTFLEHHLNDPRAELAANLMLDSMIQARKLDDVREVADAIWADRPFVDGKPELQRTLTFVRTRSLR